MAPAIPATPAAAVPPHPGTSQGQLQMRLASSKPSPNGHLKTSVNKILLTTAFVKTLSICLFTFYNQRSLCPHVIKDCELGLLFV